MKDSYSKPVITVFVESSTPGFAASSQIANNVRVVINGTSSVWLAVSSGVPQGTVLGPVLFLLYINDLPNSISSNAKLFADDSVVYRQIQRVEGHFILRQNLFNLEQRGLYVVLRNTSLYTGNLINF